ncbi:MAG: Hsp20/alpha crystallin family protein [Myxococcales bacterium]|jgi:HSP20 family protein|nr:Hsp20/alpha crystallin family protein [Myxococcales bacterium]
MMTYWNLSDPYRAFDTLRRRMDQVFRDYDAGASNGRARPTVGYPRVDLHDTKEAFVLTAEVPGMTENDVQIAVTSDSLTIQGERKSAAPEGYAVHRQERGQLRFARSFAMPARVDVEKVTATVKHGVLTVTLPKHPDSQPKSITVKAH